MVNMKIYIAFKSKTEFFALGLKNDAFSSAIKILQTFLTRDGIIIST